MATAAAALSARARREIQHAFFSADAVSPDRAIAFLPDNGFERRHFDRLRNAGAVHEERPGFYWLDMPAYDRMLRQRFDRVRLALLLLVLAALTAGTIGVVTGHLR